MKKSHSEVIDIININVSKYSNLIIDEIKEFHTILKIMPE